MTTPRSTGQTTTRLVYTRLLPILFLGQLLVCIDRTNISFAALQMNDDLGVSAEMFGLAAGIFFLGYALAEVPSNLLLQRVGARRWLGTLVLAWGLVTVVQAFVPNPVTFVLLRFLLGLTEGGFLPGVFLFLTYWLPADSRARAAIVITAATPIAAVIGGPLAGLLMHLEVAGLAGWQWLFLVEGIAPVALALVWFRVVPSSPAAARWLPQVNRDSLLERLAAERDVAARESHGLSDLVEALRQKTVWVYSLAYFVLLLGYYGIFLWLPQIIEAGFSGISTLHNGLLSAVPFIVGLAALAFFGRTASRTGDRRWHLITFGLVSGAALVLGVLIDVPILAFVATCVAMGCGTAYIGLFWASPMAILSGSAAAVGFALVNGIGNLGSFLGPYFAGLLRGASGSFTLTTLMFAAFLFASAVVPLTFRRLFPNLLRLQESVETLRTERTKP
ncbi:MAG: MFS transporter [Streptosporangiales bacterium]|nr:MFS transporter [Streptosporangiales bacterium]